jgi:hypothetical protein
MRFAASVVLMAIAPGLLAVYPRVSTTAFAQEDTDGDVRAVDLRDAQRWFYNGDYEKASAATAVLCTQRPDDLDACELRTASLHFQIKQALRESGERSSKTAAWDACASCPALLSMFVAETARAQAFARTTLRLRPEDQKTLFFLGKVDLNYVWLQSGTLGRKTGWNEYWEARRSLDQVLRLNPAHVRGRVARAWVDYIVGSTVPGGVRWVLGGGNKTRGLRVVRDVAKETDGEFFDRVEAMFALWDMQVREHDVAGAVGTARVLTRDFPENRELRKFLVTSEPTTPAINPTGQAP